MIREKIDKILDCLPEEELENVFLVNSFYTRRVYI